MACGTSQPVVALDVTGSGSATESFESTAQHGWDLHWSYDCSTAGGHGVFVADVFVADRTPDFARPGVSEEGNKDSGVYHVPGTGRFYLEVTSTCRWAVEVTE